MRKGSKVQNRSDHAAAAPIEYAPPGAPGSREPIEVRDATGKAKPKKSSKKKKKEDEVVEEVAPVEEEVAEEVVEEVAEDVVEDAVDAPEEE
tara:strand:- start:335 stop:610 length:276 start_codon:yes stop_codon:yes gene_type:complete